MRFFLVVISIHLIFNLLELNLSKFLTGLSCHFMVLSELHKFHENIKIGTHETAIYF